MGRIRGDFEGHQIAQVWKNWIPTSEGPPALLPTASGKGSEDRFPIAPAFRPFQQPIREWEHPDPNTRRNEQKNPFINMYIKLPFDELHQRRYRVSPRLSENEING
jgi:hypothetical protein